ncbi:ribonuclease H-like domain-containing protein [Tanacetum coccineum]
MADLGASVNVIPKSMFEHLKLANLKKTDMLVEMDDMTKRAPIGIVENVLVKIDKFLFPSDFMVIDMLNTRNETMILRRPFLATIHAEIDVFNKEISLGIGDDRVTFDMDKKIHNFMTHVGKIYMVNSIHKDESSTSSNAPSDKSPQFEKSNNMHHENNNDNYMHEQNSKKISDEEPAPQIAPMESPQMISTVKLHMLKKGEYTLWSMRIEQYLTNTYYGLWQVIMNGDEPVQITKDENGVETEYQLRFHTIKDAKSLWAAIKSMFGGNVESKKMQKNVLKQQFENFSVSDTKGLDKAYDSSTFTWNNIALIMRNKEGIDELDIDDLYNNLKVFEVDIKGSSGSSSNSQNVAFLFAEDTNSINEVNTANGVSTAAGHSSQGQASSSSYTNDIMFSFFADQSSGPQLNDEDLEQIDQDNLEEIDIKWKVTMLSIRVKRFYKKTGRKLIFNGKEPVGFDKTKVECFNYHRRGYFAREFRTPRNQGNMNRDAGIKFEVKDKGNAVTRLTNQLEQTLKEKEDLKAELEQFETSSKNLNKLINSQISSTDKTGLGYGDQLNENDSSGSELFNSVFDSRSSDGDDNQTNDRFKKDNEYHAVPHPLTRNYMPPLADLSFAGLDDFVYRPTTNKTSASVS